MSLRGTIIESDRHISQIVRDMGLQILFRIKKKNRSREWKIAANQSAQRTANKKKKNQCSDTILPRFGKYRIMVTSRVLNIERDPSLKAKIRRMNIKKIVVIIL